MTSDRGFAGASAYRESARMRRERAEAADAAPASIRDLLRDAGRRSPEVAAWEKGAAGETVVGRVLDGVPGIRVLHDRAIPASAANIDHIAIAPTGVYVVDAKNYSGQPRAETVGAGERRLYVGRDDRTELVESVHWQAAIVRALLADPAVPVRGVLCFVGAEWETRNGILVGEIGVTSPDGVAALLASPGPLAALRRDAIRDRLATFLEPR